MQSWYNGVAESKLRDIGAIGTAHNDSAARGFESLPTYHSAHGRLCDRLLWPRGAQLQDEYQYFGLLGAARQLNAALTSTTQVWRSARAENATVVREKRRLITLPVALVLRVLRERVFECLDDP